MRTVPVVLELAERVAERARGQAPGSSTSRTRSASSRARCSTPATAPSACATSRSASSARSPACSASSRTGSQVDQVGLNHLTWIRARAARRARRPRPTLLARTATSSPSSSSCRGALLDELGAIPSYYLHYFYAHDGVLAEQRDGMPRAQAVADDRARAPADVSRPDLDGEAGAARAARRRPLQRGGDRPRRLARTAGRRRPRRRHAQRRHARRPGRRRRRRGSGARRRGRRRPARRSTPLAPELLGLVQHVAAYERLAAEAAVTRDPVDGAQGAPRPPARGPGRPGSTQLVDALLLENAPR